MGLGLESLDKLKDVVKERVVQEHAAASTSLPLSCCHHK